MKARTCLAAIGVTALAGTGALVLPALASASASSPTHTLKFISLEKKSVNFTKTTGGQQDTDVNTKGKIIGFDELYFKLTSKTTSTANVTLDTTGGMLYGTLKISFTSPLITGKVTGGTGAFKGATGTIRAKELNSAGVSDSRHHQVPRVARHERAGGPVNPRADGPTLGDMRAPRLCVESGNVGAPV